MPLKIIRNDITAMAVDAIVNPTNLSRPGDGGVDGRIHQAAGPRLLELFQKQGAFPVGGAVLTAGCRLPCKYVIHTVGPVWQGGCHGEQALLTACYSSALELAKKHRCKTLAFPLLSAGSCGYPREQAVEAATSTIGAFLREHDMTVYLVVYDRESFQISSTRYAHIEAYIDDCYAEKHSLARTSQQRRLLSDGSHPVRLVQGAMPAPENRRYPSCAPMSQLHDRLSAIDESFSEMLLRKIDESGMTDSQCYKKANVDRKLFSKIRSSKSYKPSKPTAIAFAIALELSLEETKELLMKAGFALSHSNKFDIIIEYFIETGNYNIFEINEALFAFDQVLLGA